MITQEMLDFIRAQDAAGKPRSEIKNQLIAHGGWSSTSIDEAFSLVPLIESEASVSQASAPTAAVPVQKKGKRWVAATAAAVLILGILSASAYAFVPSVQEAVTYTFASPEERAYLGLMKLATAESYAFQYSVVASVQVIEEGTSPLSSFMKEGLLSGGELSGAGVSRKIESSEEGQSQREILANFALTAGGEEGSVELQGEVYSSPESTAFRLTGPEEFIIFDFSKVLNRWIDLSPDALAEGATEAGVPEEDVVGLSVFLQLQNETIAYLVKETPNFVVLTQLSDDEINGEKAWHYRFEIDREALREILKRSPLLASEEITEDMRKELAEELEKNLETDLGAGELWVGQRSHNPLKVTWTQRETVDTASFMGTGTYEKTTVTTGTFSNFNEKVTIEKPSDMLTLMEAVKLLVLEFGSLEGN